MERTERQFDNVRQEAQDQGQPLGVCYTPSAQFEALIEDHDEDPRSALGAHAINESKARGGAWTPSWDERRYFNPRGGELI